MCKMMMWIDHRRDRPSGDTTQDKQLSKDVQKRRRMKYILNSREMKQCDSRTIEHYGLPSMVLMERAALSVVSFFA